MLKKILNQVLRKVGMEVLSARELYALREDNHKLQTAAKLAIKFDYGDTTMNSFGIPSKAEGHEMEARFREIISDPLNLLIQRVPSSGCVSNDFITLHNGNQVPLKGVGSYYDELFGRILVYNRGVHEPLEEFLFQELIATLPEKPVMVELGCYWAHYSMWLKKLRPNAEVYMVEPDDNNIQSGIHNFKKNGFNGKFINEFVGAGQWEVDKFMTEGRLERISILHSDIQGYEVEMLKSAGQSLASLKIDYIIVSTHSSDLHAQVEEMLKAYGYSVEISSDFLNETTSHDGLIFAVSPLARSIFDGFHHFGRSQIALANSQQIINSINDAMRSINQKNYLNITNDIAIQ